MLRKLGSYPRQNGLALALRELGRIERTLFILDWLQSVELRRRVHAGLNKGEARNALARAVFFGRLGEIRDRSFEQQRYRASGLNLVTAAIVLWNTVYLDRATRALARDGSHLVDPNLLQYLSPLGWEHINLTGDYLWRSSAKLGAGRFRPLRRVDPLRQCRFANTSQHPAERCTRSCTRFTSRSSPSIRPSALVSKPISITAITVQLLRRRHQLRSHVHGAFAKLERAESKTLSTPSKWSGRVTVTAGILAARHPQGQAGKGCDS